MTARRLATGGRIDRAKPINFTWDGKAFSGYQGDTLASALLASGEKVFGRSFKYHRPRGVMSAGVEESGAIVTVGSGNRTEPNVKATTQELYEGLEAFGQNAWPNVRFDVGAVSGLFGRFFAAGFYYKTFMGLPPFEWGRGTGLWMQYEKIIRKAAGMGTASREADPDHYDHAHGFCDVLVVGGGIAGLFAAIQTAEAGRDVWLIEQDFALGGDLLNGADTETQRLELIAAAEKAGVRIMTRTTVFGLYDHGVAGLVQRVSENPQSAQPRQRFWTIRTEATILATGALERHIAFGNNDVPGVMTAQAARSYLNRYGVLLGQRVVVTTNNDSAYPVAEEFASAGAEVQILDTRPHHVVESDLPVQSGLATLQAEGSKSLRAVRYGQRKCACDLLLVSGGFSPVVNLASHRGIKPVWNGALACFLAPESSESLFMAGSAAGVFSQVECADSGVAAADRALGKQAKTVHIGGWQNPIQPVYEIRGGKKSFVDFQHDVTTDDVRLAHQEGFVSVEHLKRYTTLGMATDQGKMGNIIGLALMAEALGKDIPEVGTTTFRPPYTPVAIGALAGRNTGLHFKPLRRSPLHDWNLRHGAEMVDAGLWQRPWYFPKDGETLEDSYIREAATVRETVGLCDVSSLGKIALQGPDVSEFLNRIYSNAFAKLPVGKARYGVMLRDDGIVLDDGTVWRLAENNFLMTTTTAQAVKVMAWLEELLHTRWPNLRVHATSVTDLWAGVAVAGPKSRETIAKCLEKPKVISDENLPFMGVRTGSTTMKNGVACFIARISFSGERAYELYVPAGQAEGMMDLLWESAQKQKGCLYGLEALGTLRIEKGHVTGAELDGRVTIDDAGLGKMASTKKSFIGSVLRQRPELERTDRPKLVGIFPTDRTQRFKGGAILCRAEEVSGLGIGWITAVTYSPALGHWIGLGFIEGGHEGWQGKELVASDPTRSGDVAVEVVSPHMFDPTGERMYG